MDIATLAQALVALLTPVLPLLMKAGEKSVEEMGKKVGESAWNFAKKIWSRLTPKINANSSAKEAINDCVKNPKDDDYIAVFRVQLKKILKSDPSLAQELISQLDDIERATREININIGNINVGGNVYGGTFVSGNDNVFQNGQYYYYYTVNIGNVEKAVFGKENQSSEMKEVSVNFLQPDGTYPKHSWIDKTNTFEIILGQSSKNVNEKWEPAGINFAVLKKLLLREINKWSSKGWELVETDIDKLFISDYDSSETIGSAIGKYLPVPTGLAWNRWRIYYGARFHVKRIIN